MPESYTDEQVRNRQEQIITNLASGVAMAYSGQYVLVHDLLDETMRLCTLLKEDRWKKLETQHLKDLEKKNK